MLDLLFGALRDTDPPVDLVFGQRTGPVVDAAGHLDITLPAVMASFAGQLQVDNAVSRSDIITAGGGWQAGRAGMGVATAARHHAGLPVPATRSARWRPGIPMVPQSRAAWRDSFPLRSRSAACWAKARPLPTATALSAWQSGIPTPRAVSSAWQAGRGLRAVVASLWQTGIIIRPSPRHVPWGAGLPTVRLVTSSAANADPLRIGLVRVRWQGAEPLSPGRSPGVAVPPQPGHGCYTPPPGLAVHLQFNEQRTAGFDVLFSCGLARPVGPVVVPVLESYFVINTVTLVRADTGEPVEAESIQVGIGRDGPHWSWSASIPGSSRHLVARNPNSDPVELLLTLNGAAIRLVVERRRRDRSHGSDAVMVYGRSRSAWLSDPHAGVLTRYNASPMTARQLAADVLTINGVSIGWGLDWQLPDWLVPEGVWSHQGTYMDALVRLAEAGGGYLQASPSEMTMAALPHYPVAPWDWASATPDIVLPEDVVEVEGTEDADKPGYNAVYVEGQGVSGRRDRILRAGSAGDMLAPQIIDALATHVDMTRARGLAVLADSGPQSLISLRVPVLDGVGLILPGKLVEYVAEGTTRRGLTRSMSAAWSLPELWQTIEIEIHG